jgi:hypothetical protein
MMVGGLAPENPTTVGLKASHFEREIVRWGVRWYVVYLQSAIASARR